MLIISVKDENKAGKGDIQFFFEKLLKIGWPGMALLPTSVQQKLIRGQTRN